MGACPRPHASLTKVLEARVGSIHGRKEGQRDEGEVDEGESSEGKLGKVVEHEHVEGCTR